MIENDKVIGHIDNQDTEIVQGIIKNFCNNDISVVEINIDREEYHEYCHNAGYKNRYPAYYSNNIIEKSLEHFLTIKNLVIKKGERFVDIASEHSPLPEICERLFGADSYSQDIMYPPGIAEKRIGGDACNLPVENSFFDKLSLTCSLEHFEGQSDSFLLKEINRILKPGGIAYIAPLYLFKDYSIQTDPMVSVPNGVKFDKGAIIYCAEGWGNRHGRFYNFEAFKTRILPFIGTMKVEIQYIKNAKQIDNSCYIVFALKLWNNL